MAEFQYIITPKKVIALKEWAGRTYRGIAKCHPNDIFDQDFGMTLAAARCNEKISKEKFRIAREIYERTAADYVAINKRLTIDSHQYTAAYENLQAARKYITHLKELVQ